MFNLNLWKIADEENRKLIVNMIESGDKLLDL